MLDTSSLTYLEQQVLSCFFVLPSEEMRVADLFDFFQITEAQQVSFFDCIHDLSTKGWLQRLKGNYKLNDSVRQTIKNTVNPNTEKCSLVINFFVNKLVQVGKKENIQRYLPYVDNILNNLTENTKPLAVLANNFAVYYDKAGQSTKCVNYLHRAVEIQKNIDHTILDLAFYYNNLAIAYRKSGNLRKSIEFSYKSIDINKRLNDTYSGFMVNSYSILSSTYQKLKNHDKAIEYNLKAVEIGEYIYPANHNRLADLYYDLAVSYYNSLSFSNAKYFMDLAVDIYRKNLPEDHKTLKYSLKDQQAFNSLYRFDAFMRKYGKYLLLVLAAVILVLISWFVVWIFKKFVG